MLDGDTEMLKTGFYKEEFTNLDYKISIPSKFSFE